MAGRVSHLHVLARDRAVGSVCLALQGGHFQIPHHYCPSRASYSGWSVQLGQHNFDRPHHHSNVHFYAGAGAGDSKECAESRRGTQLFLSLW